MGGTACRICGSPTRRAGPVQGRSRGFELRRCDACGFAMVADPLDPATVYTADYYAGRGVDPLVDYAYELAAPDRTVRTYEWRGIEAIVRHLSGGACATWMDFGCGNGGLVRHLRTHGIASEGFDEGAIVADGRAAGIPILEREALDARRGAFDVVTAVEVLEHTLDPLAELRLMRSLLRPGGLLFLTTGNAAPFRDRLTSWRYVVPEMHISFFEPGTLATALEGTGFRPVPADGAPGWDDVYRFKALKNLRVRRRSAATDLLPAGLLRRHFDARLQLTALPAAIAV